MRRRQRTQVLLHISAGAAAPLTPRVGDRPSVTLCGLCPGSCVVKLVGIVLFAVTLSQVEPRSDRIRHMCLEQQAVSGGFAVAGGGTRPAAIRAAVHLCMEEW